MTEHTTKEGCIFYRYVNHRTISGVHIYLHKYVVSKVTEKGVWVVPENFSSSYRKFILLSAKKKYAHASEKEALDSFIARKKRQILILQSQLEDAKTAYFHATHMSDKNKFDNSNIV